MARKVAIYDNTDALKFLDAARTRTDQIRAFSMLAFGLHPENLRGFEPKSINDQGFLAFKRAKNDRPRSEFLPEHQAKAMRGVIKRGKFRISNTAYELMCEYMGKSLPDYPTPPVSPLTLRHTYILNRIKEFGNNMDLVAKKAGCHRETVIQNYVDMLDWERVVKEKDDRPLDLTDFVFMEG